MALWGLFHTDLARSQADLEALSAARTVRPDNEDSICSRPTLTGASVFADWPNCFDSRGEIITT